MTKKVGKTCLDKLMGLVDCWLIVLHWGGVNFVTLVTRYWGAVKRIPEADVHIVFDLRCHK